MVILETDALVSIATSIATSIARPLIIVVIIIIIIIIKKKIKISQDGECLSYLLYLLQDSHLSKPSPPPQKRQTTKPLQTFHGITLHSHTLHQSEASQHGALHLGMAGLQGGLAQLTHIGLAGRQDAMVADVLRWIWEGYIPKIWDDLVFEGNPVDELRPYSITF